MFYGLRGIVIFVFVFGMAVGIESQYIILWSGLVSSCFS